MGNGNGWATMWLYLTPLNCSLKNGYSSTFLFCVFYPNVKKKNCSPILSGSTPPSAEGLSLGNISQMRQNCNFLLWSEISEGNLFGTHGGLSMPSPPRTRPSLGKDSWTHHFAQACSWHMLSWLIEWCLFYKWAYKTGIPVSRRHKWFSQLFWRSEDPALLLPQPLVPRRKHFLKLCP